MSKVSRCCLVCNYQIKTYHSPEDEYQEVTVCPKCKGAFVDVWCINKYKQNNNLNQFCEHNYHVLDSKTTTTSADGSVVSINVLASFYCENCLDIQYREKRIDTRSEDRR